METMSASLINLSLRNVPRGSGKFVADILIRRPGEAWRDPANSGYTSESHLQAILLEHPQLIPGVAKDAKVCIEFQSGVGPSDVVAVDMLNGLTLVECKLASNREVRREIIGQVLDYAARFWRMSVEDFDAQWLVRNSQSLFADGVNSQDLRARLEESLTSGEFRVVLAVDEINEDLRRIVEYLNHVTTPAVAVIAVVYSRSEDQGTEILSRQIYGEELAESKSAKSRREQNRWKQGEFLAWVDENEPEASRSARTILDALSTEGLEISGGKAATPSLNARMLVEGAGWRWPVVLYTQKRGTTIEFRFEDLKSFPEIAERFLVAVESVPGISIDGAEVRRVAYSKRPNPLIRDMSDEMIRTLIKVICDALMGPR
jgi:hypothetical protein